MTRAKRAVPVVCDGTDLDSGRIALRRRLASSERVPVEPMDLPHERLHAVLMAGASGDAMGGPFEGSAADPARTLPAPPWRPSDDTRLTFATCRAIAKVGAIDPEAIAAEFVVEFRAGLAGVGSSTLKALRDLAVGQHWALSGARGEFAAGNGAAMRIAPLAVCGDVRDPAAMRSIRDVASITHRNDEAIAGAVAVVRALQYLGGGHAGQELLTTLIDELPDTALSDSLAKLVELPARGTASDAAEAVGTSGRTAESVALALFIGARTTTIEAAITAAIRCGGDTDTTAALAAQLRAAAGEELSSSWAPHLPVDEASRMAEALRRRVRPPVRR
jgi:ADP-ribosylglycohydrolase